MNLHDAWHIRLEAEREAKIKSLEKEVARLRLTDAEREAVETARSLFSQGWKHFDNEADRDRAAALRGLLERLGNS